MNPIFPEAAALSRKPSKVGLFVPCCMDQFAPLTAQKAMRLFESLDLQIFYPTELTCCGMELYLQGDRDGAKSLGEKLISLYDDCSHIVSLSSGCVVYMQKNFGRLFHNTTLHNNYRQFVERCYDFSDFLINVLHVDDGKSPYRLPETSFEHKVTVMDHCTTLGDYHCLAHPATPGLRNEPRRLLHTVKGLQLVEMQQQEVCCGSGGTFASQFTPISDSLAQRKVNNALAAGAEYITSTEMRCLLHINSFAEKNNIPVKCMHIIDIICASL